MEKPVLLHPPFSWHLARMTRQQAGAIVIAAIGIAGVAWWAVVRKRISPEEVERQRRDLLSVGGRIIDGSIIGVDGVTEDDSADGSLELDAGAAQPPRMLLYRYRIAGVTYECAQDVTALADQVAHIRIDLPVQVRYDPHNPADSILVAEGWSGLQQENLFDQPI